VDQDHCAALPARYGLQSECVLEALAPCFLMLLNSMLGDRGRGYAMPSGIKITLYCHAAASLAPALRPIVSLFVKSVSAQLPAERVKMLLPNSCSDSTSSHKKNPRSVRKSCSLRP
jgi:hypothetical protein